METSAQRDAARCLIEKISREHTLDGAIRGTKFGVLVTNCLEILSSQLYEKSTHFLLELIQNADDNTYDCSAPTLSFSYKPGSLRIDCNEVGFTAENVEAICTISRSTKSGKTSDGEFIGEKGIGFKSVFKAADVVWISSREYTFKFDKTEFLGMVTPIWADFPEPTQPGCTSIFLQLSECFEEETLIQELLTFDTNILIFLRRIAEINIRVTRQDEQVWEKKIKKTERQQEIDRMTLLQVGEHSFQYLIRTHVIQDLPKERKRPNWKQTKILLAFPTAEFLEQPQFIPQKVYAFLPIRSYGLKFLLQADFLLTASREDIESTLPWNQKIRDALADAFLQSIEHFNAGALKYDWPYYLPSASTAAGSFREPAVTSILTQLRESDVLESWANTMVKPSSLKHVPLDRFGDGEGIPFTLNPRNETSYLSSKYSPWALDALSSIGVTQLSPQEFLADLNSSITQNPMTFRGKSATWHSQLSEALLKLATDTELMSMIEDICLIPLHDGSWTSAKGQSMFFSKSETSLEIPSGIEVLIVDSTAEADHNRRKLFTTLGVKAWEASEICRLVLNFHESSSFDPKALTIDQLISHAAFLYKASWQPPKTADLWFATMQDERDRGRKLYMLGSVENDSAEARIFAQLQQQFPVVHDDYGKKFPQDADWPVWLVNNLGVSKVPRLITPFVEPKPQPTQTLKSHKRAKKFSVLSEEFMRDSEGSDLEDLAEGDRKLAERHVEEEDLIDYRDVQLQPNNVSQAAEDSVMHDEELEYYKKQPYQQPKYSPPPRRPKPDNSPRSDEVIVIENPDYESQSVSSDGLASLVDEPHDRNIVVRGRQLHPKAPPIAFEEEDNYSVEFGEDLEPYESGAPPPPPPPPANWPGGPGSPPPWPGGGMTSGTPEIVYVTRQASWSPRSPRSSISSSYEESPSRSRSSSRKPAKGVLAWMAEPSKGARSSRKGKSRRRTSASSSTHTSTRSLSPSPSLIETLPAPGSNVDETFSLSEEFMFMLQHCNSSDVLQLLRDNWHHYSQWIDGTHMKWQNPEFLESSTQLKNTLAACMVQSAKGPLPLQETVFPAVDSQLEEGGVIPVVDIKDPQHPEWTLLSHFGVLMKGDVYYYFRCLISISERQCLDFDSVAYIYEQIQAKYQGNEDFIRAAFNERDIILVHLTSSGLTNLACWTNMKQCVLRDIAIDSEYPSCSYLFRCLESPKGDPIGPIVTTASLITSSTKLEDISRLFLNVCTAIKDVNASKAAQLLKPLRNKSIFPITNGPGKRKYDKLLDMHNNSWFIADRPVLHNSFHGKLPLLALPVEDISGLGDLFRVLRLDGRMLSKLTTSRTQATGRVTMDWTSTSSLRRKVPFIKALIPQSHRDRTTIVRQIEEVRVSVATAISQTFSLNLSGTEIHGTPVCAQVSLSHAGNMLNITMTEECAEAECPPHELVALIADACDIKDTNHYSLLFTALSSARLESIFSTFTQQGIAVKGLVFDKSRSKYRAQYGESIHIPSPFWEKLKLMEGSFRGLPSAMKFQRQSGRAYHGHDGDRRLPILESIRVGGSGCEDISAPRLVYENDKTDGWDHVQYLGENIISKALGKYLEDAYVPERDWTSRLRSRAGHEPFAGSMSCAAFTMRDPKAIDKMTAFVIEYGNPQTPKWKENLRTSRPIYHIDVVVSEGSKSSPFVIITSQVERMRQFRMHNRASYVPMDIAVLFRVTDVYSKDRLSVDIFVDPWRLFNSNGINLERNWMVRGILQDSNSGSGRKRRELSTPSTAWGKPTTLGVDQIHLTNLRGARESAAYAHGALHSGNIRLLYLLPGERANQLEGVIIHVPYQSAGIYRALSYVWGTDQRTQELVTPDGVLLITLSLSKALRGLRHQTKPIVLWVDAICINQMDDTEKAKQIRLLPKIFQRAASTFAFLEGGDGSDSAIETLMQIRAKAACDENSKVSTRITDDTELEFEDSSEYDTDSAASTVADELTCPEESLYSELWPKDLARLPASWRHRCIPYLDDPIWTAVAELFSLPWFRRVWIIQEIVGAPHVKIVCGKWIIDWNDLYLAIEIVDREVQLSDDDYSQLRSSWEPFLSLAAQREWEARKYRWALIMLLENFRYAESTLSRDRLFALLGLASDGNEVDFEPDYRSPLESVVLKFARVFVRQDRGMQLLYRAGLSNQSDRFPSWVPNWTMKRPPSLHDSREGGVLFSASGPQQAKIKCDPNTDELLVEGYEVDVIESISTSSNTELEWEEYFKEIDAMVDSAVLSSVRDSIQDLKWKVPVAGALYPRVLVSGNHDLRSSYTAFRSYLKDRRKGKAKEVNCSLDEGNTRSISNAYANGFEHMPATSLQNQSASYIAALQDTVHGWKFVVTKKGYVGVTPNLSQVGDVVAIMKGGRVPFIVQKSLTRPGAFRLVGECYIHCMMNGEGLSLYGVTETEFHLH